MEKLNSFHWLDYLVFASFLVLSALVGAFIGIRDRHKMTSRNFLMGGENIHWVLVALSMQASFLSAISILSIPVEVYVGGTVYYYLVVAYFLAIPFSGHFYMSTFYKMNILTAYEYLEIRFSKVVRTLCAIVFCAQILLYLSVVLYTPALALAQVTNLSVPLSIALCGLVCTFYTFLGGMKATIWNDFFQMLVIASTLICVIAFGSFRVGGLSRVWQISYQGGRIDFIDFRVNPFIRTTFWTQVVGGSAITSTMYASNQTTIQKFISVSTLRNAKKSIWMVTFSSAIFLTMFCSVGLVAYANYWDCDPLKSGQILKYDQLVPYLVMEVMGHLHGLPGLFIAATFSAALSSLSGSLTALSAVILSDFIGPLNLKMNGKNLEESTKSRVSKTLTLLLGLLVTGLGFAAQFFGEVVIQASFSIFGFVGGPLLAVITLGIFVPFVNSIGVLAGLVSSLVVTSWVAIGSILAQYPHPKLPISIDGCLSNSSADFSVTTTLYDRLTSHHSPQDSQVPGIFKVSYMYYGVIALFVAIVVAIPVSLLTGRTKKLHSRLVVDFRKSCCCCLSENCQSNFLCGTQLDEEELSTKNGLEKHSMEGFTNKAFDGTNEITVKVSLGEDVAEGTNSRNQSLGSTLRHLQPPNSQQTYPQPAQTASTN